MYQDWHYSIYDSPLGKIVIQDDSCGIARIEWEERCRLKRGTEGETEYIKEAKRQLTAYFKGERQSFDLPLRMKGTAFQQQVWHCLSTIPYGEIWTYQQIADAIGNEKAVRAVGMANNRNPLMIVVPCHRVVGMNGKLSGYCGNVERKQALLDLERQYKG